MPRPHMPLHIVGVGHICPAGKCARAPEGRSDVGTPGSTREASSGVTDAPKGQETASPAEPDNTQEQE